MLSKNPKLLGFGIILISLVCYLLGFRTLLPLALLGSLAAFLPMPRIFSSWLGRLVIAFLLLFALLQIAAALQYITAPSGKFDLIAAITVALTILVIYLFGTTSNLYSRQIISLRDVWAVVGGFLFLLPFHAILLGHAPLFRIAQIADSQISDSVNHYVQIDHMSRAQNFNYTASYYPSGFHITTAFLEDTTVKNIDTISWQAQAILFFSQYLFLGLLLIYVFIFFVFGLMDHLKIEAHWLLYLAAALAAGMSLTVMHLWLFIEEGFLNYFYICATLLVAAAWLLEGNPAYRSDKQWRTYIWPLTAYLLLGAGVSLSWPLFTPVLLVSLLCIVVPTLPHFRKQPGRYSLIHLPVIVLGLINLLAIYLQQRYTTVASGSELNLGGAIHYFNFPFMLIGLVVFAYVVYSGKFKSISTRLSINLVPYILLAVGLEVYQYFTLGMASYYLIKSAMMLEMLLLGLLIAVLFYWGRLARLSHFANGSLVIALVFFVVIGTLGMAQQPLNEIRTLFRNASGIGTPAYIHTDSEAVASLGKHGVLNNYNTTILHYDSTGDQLYAQMEVGLWAHIMAPYTSANNSKANVAGDRCSAMQYNILAYGSGNETQAQSQAQLIRAVRQCIGDAKQQGLKYYIITDQQSTAELEQLFPGSNVRLIN